MIAENVSAMKEKTMSKNKRSKKQKRINFWVDFSMVFFALIVPLIALLLYGFGVGIPAIAIGIYGAAAFIVFGVLLIVFSVREKFGHGKAGRNMRGWPYTQKEAKEEEITCGIMLIILGIILAILT